MSKAELVAAVQKSLGKETSSAQADRTVDAVINGIKTAVLSLPPSLILSAAKNSPSSSLHFSP